MFLAVLRRDTSNQPSVMLALDSVGVWTNMGMRLPAPENKATPTVVRPPHVFIEQQHKLTLSEAIQRFGMWLHS